MSKVKANDKISFPLELDMQPLLDAGDVAAEQQYDLQAILVHRGSNASSGHYGERFTCSCCSGHTMVLNLLEHASCKILAEG